MTDEQLRKLGPQLDKAIKEFRGNMNHLETAIGLIFVTHKLGWKPMLLIHDARTLARCEEILQKGIPGFSYRDAKLFPEAGPWAKKSLAWTLVQKGLNYWRAVRGQEAGVRQPTVQ